MIKSDIFIISRRTQRVIFRAELIMAFEKTIILKLGNVRHAYSESLHLFPLEELQSTLFRAIQGGRECHVPIELFTEMEQCCQVIENVVNKNVGKSADEKDWGHCKIRLEFFHKELRDDWLSFGLFQNYFQVNQNYFQRKSNSFHTKILENCRMASSWQISPNIFQTFEVFVCIISVFLSRIANFATSHC